MIKSEIQSLFPTPVYMTDINRKLTNKELSFVEEQKKYCHNNKGNINTIDNYILNNLEFITYTNILTLLFQEFFILMQIKKMIV